MDNDLATFFQSRFDPEYYNHLTDRFQNARAEALPCTDGRGCAKIIRISSIGVSGSTFFKVPGDQERNVRKTAHRLISEFDELIDNIHDLNKNGIAVSLRFIWAYPYSDYSMHLMVADKLDQKPFWMILDQLDPDEGCELLFSGSPMEYGHEEMFNNFQKESLGEFLGLLKKLRARGVNLKLNTFEARFTPVPLNFRGIFINSWAYYDIYTYSKIGREFDLVASHLPVLAVVDRDCEPAEEHEIYYRSLCRDFEYIWSHPATVLLEDSIDGNNTIKSPEDVTHRHKFEKIDALALPEGPSSDRDRAQFKFLCKHNFKNSVRIRDGKPSKESIFIGCSWENGSDGRHRPNDVAWKTKEFIEYIFEMEGFSDRLVDAELVFARPGQAIHDEIYKSLNSASHGIIILTKDNIVFQGGPQNDEGNQPQVALQFTRPNVVHELGYLNHRIRRISKGDVLTLKEVGAYYPTNEIAFPMKEFRRDHLIEVFDELMSWMANSLCAFDENAYRKCLSYLRGNENLGVINDDRFPPRLSQFMVRT